MIHKGLHLLTAKITSSPQQHNYFGTSFGPCPSPIYPYTLGEDPRVSSCRILPIVRHRNHRFRGSIWNWVYHARPPRCQREWGTQKEITQKHAQLDSYGA